MAHLRSMHSCLDRLRACFPPLPEELIVQLNASDAEHAKQMKAQGWLCTKATLPARRCQGPPLPPAGSPAAAEMHQRWTLRRPPDAEPLFEALAGHCVEPASTSNNPEASQLPEVEPLAL